MVDTTTRPKFMAVINNGNGFLKKVAHPRLRPSNGQNNIVVIYGWLRPLNHTSQSDLVDEMVRVAF